MLFSLRSFLKSLVLPLWAAFLAIAPGGGMAVGQEPSPEYSDEESTPAATLREEGALVFDGIPPLDDEVERSLIPYQNMRSAGFRDWLPGGEGLLISTRFANTPQFHTVRAPLGMRKQVTFYEEPVSGGSFGREGPRDAFLFSLDAGGNEQSQLYLHSLSTGLPLGLTDGGVNRGAIWAKTEPMIAYSSTFRNGQDFDVTLKRTDFPNSPTIRLTENMGYWYPYSFSDDDQKLLIGRYVSVNETELFVATLDEKGTSATLLELHGDAEGPVAFGDAVFDHGGTGIFYSSDLDSEFQRLRYYDLEYNVSRVVLNELPWDVTELERAHKSRTLAVVTNENGISHLRLLDMKSLEAKEVEIPQGVIGTVAFSPDDSKLAFSLYSTVSPGDVYVLDVSSHELTRWTESEVGGLPLDGFSKADFFTYPTFDKAPDGTPRRIPAFIMKPKGEGPHPVLIAIHGGPESQSRPYFSGFFNYLVNELGIAVIQPNVRGSTGYGKTWTRLDNGMLREDSVRDIGQLLDWIALQPELDSSRVGVYGGSYGGYMVLASMALFAERITCGVDVVGISNFVTFLESTKEYRQDLRRQEYGDERDPEMREFLQRISPTNMVDRIKSPLLVAQGANDPRVPKSEAEQIVEAVRGQGLPVWYFLATNEGHGFRKKENRNAFEAVVVQFLREHLLPVSNEPIGGEGVESAPPAELMVP
ncbi:MAG: alpha/beta fold hydrolase [Sumerlaeia bacterium]